MPKYSCWTKYQILKNKKINKKRGNMRSAMQRQIGIWSKGKISATDPLFKILIFAQHGFFCIHFIFFPHNVALNMICLDYWVFWCLRQVPPSLHPNPGPDSTFYSLCPTVTEELPLLGPQAPFQPPLSVKRAAEGGIWSLQSIFVPALQQLIKCCSQ